MNVSFLSQISYEFYLHNMVSERVFSAMVQKAEKELGESVDKALTKVKALEEHLGKRKASLVNEGENPAVANDISNGEFEFSKEFLTYNELSDERYFYLEALNKNRVLLDYANLDSLFRNTCDKLGTYHKKPNFKDAKPAGKNDFSKYKNYVKRTIEIKAIQSLSEKDWSALMRLIKIRRMIAHNKPMFDGIAAPSDVQECITQHKELTKDSLGCLVIDQVFSDLFSRTCKAVGESWIKIIDDAHRR